MWEKLLLAIGLTFTLQLCTQTGVFSLSETTRENIHYETVRFVAQQYDN